MFIKVSDTPERYINTDNVETLGFAAPRGTPMGMAVILKCEIVFRSGRALVVSESAGRALLEFAEVNDSVLSEPEINRTPAQRAMEAVYSPLLTTRIAQYLRDSAPSGASLMDLIMKYPAPEGELIAALDALIKEHVMVFTEDSIPPKYYHVTNAPRSLPSEEVEARASADHENRAHSKD